MENGFRYQVRQLHRRVLVDFWPPAVGTVAAGVLSAYYFGLTGALWAVTGEFTRWGGHLVQFLGVDPTGWAYMRLMGFKGNPWDRIDGWIVIGMLLGALASALMGNNFKIRVPRQRRRLLQALIGGIIAGFGARLAMGCNLAAFFTGIPQFSFHTWLFTLGTAAGSYLGVKVALHPLFLGTPSLQKGRPTRLVPEEVRTRGVSLQPTLGGITLVVLLSIVAHYADAGSYPLALGALFGGAFGLIIERGQICFTSAFRDLWVTGRGTMARALALGILAASLSTAVFLGLGAMPKVFWASPGALLGGMLFGLGIVIAGGCETGWIYRAMEGQVQFWVVGVGNILGAALLAWAWGGLGLYDLLVKDWPRVSLVGSWGLVNALLATVAMLCLAYLATLWWEARARRAVARRGGQAVKVKLPLPQQISEVTS